MPHGLFWRMDQPRNRSSRGCRFTQEQGPSPNIKKLNVISKWSQIEKKFMLWEKLFLH